MPNTDRNPVNPPPALPTAVANFPIPPVTTPSPLVSLPKIRITGPIDAAIAANLMSCARWLSSRFMKRSSSSDAPSMSFWMVGFRSLPICRANIMAVFFRLASLLSVVAYRFPASSVSAVFSPHAAVAVTCVLAKSSVAFVARSSVSRRRISLMPISSSTAIALSPSSSS